MPPPPCELLVTDKPSMRDGLHQKSLVNAVQLGVLALLAARSVVPSGNVSAANSVLLFGKFTPFDRTVMPAPSYAPMRVGSCNCSARLPLSVASQPTVASSGRRSTCGSLVVAVKPVNPVPQSAFHEPCSPSGPSPNRQTTRWRQAFSSVPAGCVLASMMLEAAPTPCNRTGFHISNNSWYVPGGTMIRSPAVAWSIAD